MNALAPWAGVAVWFLTLPYALSAETSPTLKWRAVVVSSDGRNSVSAASRSWISTAVTMFVLTPHMRWALTQSCSRLSHLRYFLSYHGTKRLDVKPVESTAKSVSIAFNGKLLTVMRSVRIGESVGFSR